MSKIELPDLSSHATEHFTYREMLTSPTAVRLGIDNTPDTTEILDNVKKVALMLEKVRAHYGVPIYVNSCFRAPAVNRAVGGSPTSAHRFGLAADFTVKGVPNIEVCKWIGKNIPDFDQVIYEFGPSGWVHLGFASKPRKQLLTAVKIAGNTVYKQGIVS